jgi:outer membrane protein TolC
VNTYGRALLLDALGRAARAAVVAAERDVKRARDRQDVGRATGAEADVARARLNDLVGAPLDTVFVLDAMPTAAETSEPRAVLEDQALDAHPAVLLARVDQRLADAAQSGARASFLPHVAFRTVWDWNGGTFGSRESAWLVGTENRFNLFRGLADRARLAQAAVAVERRVLDRTRIENEARLEARAAIARLAAAEARRTVARTVVAQARESARIVRDRYENGMADVTALLQVARAELDAEAQEAAAHVERLQRAALDCAVGR